MSALLTNETVKYDRRIICLQGHMNKYLGQKASMPTRVEHAKLSELNVQPVLKIQPREAALSPRYQWMTYNTKIQGKNPCLFNQELEENKPQQTLRSNNLSISKKLCFGQHARRPTRVIEALRFINHCEENTRFNPTGSSRARGRW